MSFKSNPKQGNNEMKKKNKEMKKKNKMWALLMSAVMLALGTAQAVPWNEDDVVVTYGDTAVTPTFYENVTLSFDGEAAKDGDVVAVFRGDNVFCGYGLKTSRCCLRFGAAERLMTKCLMFPR